MERSQVTTRIDLKPKIRPFRKPGNADADAYLPFISFYARQTFRGWILAGRLDTGERLLTNCSTWVYGGRKENFSMLYRISNGVFQTVFRKVTRGRRARMLEPKRKEQGSQFFQTYLACVLTLRNATEWPALCGLEG